MKKCFFLLLVLCLLLCSCQAQRKQYSVTYLDLFDTVTTIQGIADNEETFDDIAMQIHDQLLQYHRLFDIYNTYNGIVNLKSINDNAGIQPITVDSAIIELLTDCKQYYQDSNGIVNVAMGNVLRLWHEARNDGIQHPESAYLPSADSLQKAAQHIDFSCVEIDRENATVYITDPQTQLDVGAIAKGWALQQVAENAPRGLLINSGGNICVTGEKDGSTPWTVGIAHPDGGSFLEQIRLTEGCVVTSGDYQRCYTVAGKSYHHIIDPNTLYPSPYWRSVTVICRNSAVADMLSTALFILPQEDGQALLEQYNAQAMWMDADGNLSYSSGFPLS